MTMQALRVNSTLQGGKYRIIEKLGQGGFGITYLAENTMLEGKVAIKEFFFKEYCERDNATCHVTIPKSDNREIVERFKQKFIKARLKLREAKKREREKNSQKGDGITLPDIISSLCAYGIGYTMLNVWDLTIYQLYDQFEKVTGKDRYDKDYAAILAGADAKKIKLKNWMTNP